MQSTAVCFLRRARAVSCTMFETIKFVLCSGLVCGHQQNELNWTMNAIYQEADF